MSLARSRELFEKSQRFLAGGVASTLRRAIEPSPLFISHGRGSHIFDVDGNDYVDFTMAYGPLILGHAHPAIVAAVGSVLARGSTFGAQHEGEIELVRDGGDAYVVMNRLGEALAKGLREAADSAGVPLLVNSAGQAFFTLFTEEDEVWSVSSFERRDQARRARFAELLLGEGVYVRPNGLWYVSTAHTEADVEYTLAAAARALAVLNEEESA